MAALELDLAPSFAAAPPPTTPGAASRVASGAAPSGSTPAPAAAPAGSAPAPGAAPAGSTPAPVTAPAGSTPSPGVPLSDATTGPASRVAQHDAVVEELCREWLRRARELGDHRLCAVLDQRASELEKLRRHGDPEARAHLRARATERRRADVQAADDLRNHGRAMQELAQRERLAKAEAEAAKAKGWEARAAAKASVELAKVTRENAQALQAPVRQEARILSRPRGVDHGFGSVVGFARLASTRDAWRSIVCVAPRAAAETGFARVAF